MDIYVVLFKGIPYVAFHKEKDLAAYLDVHDTTLEKVREDMNKPMPERVVTPLYVIFKRNGLVTTTVMVSAKSTAIPMKASGPGCAISCAFSRCQQG